MNGFSVALVTPGEPWLFLLTERSQPCELLVHHVAAVRRGRVTERAKRTGPAGRVQPGDPRGNAVTANA
jgi:hypothetical protein